MIESRVSWFTAGALGICALAVPAAFVVMPPLAGLACLPLCACCAVLIYGRQVYQDCVNGGDV